MGIQLVCRGWAVYPRVCGGTCELEPGTAALAGLSPRVRGNPGPGRGGDTGDGSIPACAGEPCRGGNGRGLRRVYPRVCGGTAVS